MQRVVLVLRHYLCSSDWTKQTSAGDVFERSILEVMADTLAMLRSREPVCRTCNHDAINRLTAEMVRRDAGEPSDVERCATLLELEGAGIEELAAEVAAYVGVDPDRAAPPVRRPRIPVNATAGHGAEGTCGHPGGCGAA